MGSPPPQPSQAACTQPDWFRRAFDTLYPLIYQHHDDASARREIAALAQTLAWRPGRRVLDIACGAGRHLRALRDAGFNAVGMDLSMTLLREAFTKRRLRGEVACGDVRAIPFQPGFEIAVNLFTSFGYFGDDAENFAALRAMAGVLRPGGMLVMDHMNRRKVQAELVPHDVKRIGDLSVESRRSIEGDHVVKQMTIQQPGGNQERIIERVRLFSPEQLTDWFQRAGLRVERVMGTFDGTAFRDDSARMMMVGVRA